jgi:hypothetical protein
MLIDSEHLSALNLMQACLGMIDIKRFWNVEEMDTMPAYSSLKVLELGACWELKSLELTSLFSSFSKLNLLMYNDPIPLTI